MNFDHWLTKTLAYSAFGLVVFLGTLLLTYPDGRISQIAAVQIENQLERRFDRNFEVDVDDFDLWWLWGAELEGVSIQRVPRQTDTNGDSSSNNSSNNDASDAADSQKSKGAAPKQKQKNSASPTDRTLSLTVDSVGARLAPFSSLMNGALAVTYAVGLGDGTIGGTVVRGSDALDVSTSLDAVNLSEIEIIEQYSDLPVFGELSGDVSLSFMPNSPVVKSGNISIDGKQLQLGPKTGMKMEGLPIDPDIPATNLGNLTIRMAISSEQPGRPQVKIETFNAEGRDIERLQIWGNIELGSRLGRTKLRLKMRTKLRSEFIDKNNLGPILQIKQFRNGQRDDWYGFVAVGYLSDLNFKGASAATSGPPESGSEDADLPGDSSDDGADEQPGAPSPKGSSPKRPSPKAPSPEAPSP